MANNRVMTDTEVLKIIIESAKLYKYNLANKNMIIISYNTKSKTYSYIETVFLERNFLHMTGVQLKSEENKKLFNPNIGGAIEFYNSCLSNELKVSDFKQAGDGTTSLKMLVLPQLVRLHGNLMGDFNGTKNRLVTEKLVGNLRGCMGFVMEGNYYVPNTVIQDDIRDITYKANSIICIFEKHRKDKEYTEIRYLKKEKMKVKKVNGEKVMIPPVDHVKGICKLNIVVDKVNMTIFE